MKPYEYSNIDEFTLAKLAWLAISNYLYFDFLQGNISSELYIHLADNLGQFKPEYEPRKEGNI